MNQSDFAKLHGVSRKTITTWKARGWLVVDDDGIDVEASNANIKRYRKIVTQQENALENKSKGNNGGNKSKSNKLGNRTITSMPESISKTAERMITENGSELALADAQLLKANYIAKLTQLNYELKAGQVLPYADMLQAVSDEYSRVRTRLVAIAPEHGPRLKGLASITTDAEFVAALQEVIYEAMEELSIDTRKQRGNT